MTQALLLSAVEYFLVVVPVAVYVWIVSMLSNQTEHRMFSSPEWNIATIFIAVQGLYAILGDLARSKRRRPSIAILGLIVVTVIILTIGAVINIVLSFPEPRKHATTWMWIEFAVVTVMFVLFASGTRLVADSAD